MAREIANVTHGIGTYVGTAANDRSVRVTWAPIAGTYGMTETRTKKVTLNPSLLTKHCPTAPFTGAAVDIMQGVAAHEAGHVVLAAAHGTGHAGMIGNVVEDLMIDGPAFSAYNPGLAELTANLRVNMAVEEMPMLDKTWREAPSPATRDGLLNVWACCRLYGHRLPVLDNRKAERRAVGLLDVVADSLQTLADFTGYRAEQARHDAIRDINAVLDEYAAQNPQPPKPEPEPEDADDEDDEDGDDGAKGETGDEEEEGDEPGSGNGEGDSEGDDESNSTDKADAGDEPGDAAEAGTGNGAGKATDAPNAPGWDEAPNPCPNKCGDDAVSEADAQLWNEVAEEMKNLDIARPNDAASKVRLAAFTNKATVQGVKAAFAALASEPVRARHNDSGRIDRRALPHTMYRDDSFSRNRDRALTGQLVLILDLSGSMSSNVNTVKASAASVYEAMQNSGVKVWVYSYGNPEVAQLATPTKVAQAFVNIGSGGGTPTAEAFAAVLKDVRTRSGETNVIIHITDGVAGNVPNAIEQMAAAQKQGWKVLNIGVGSSGRTLPYEKVSDALSFIKDFTKLPKLLATAVKDIMRAHKRAISV